MICAIAAMASSTSAPSPTLSAAAVSPDARGVTIRSGADPEAGGYTIVVPAAGSMAVTLQSGVQKRALPAAAAAELFASVRNAGNLATLEVRSCRTLMSSGVLLSLEFKGVRTPGNLACGGSAAAQKLLAAVQAVIASAHLPAAPLRRRPGCAEISG